MTVYDDFFGEFVAAGNGPDEAAALVMAAFLDGKSHRRGKRPFTGLDRHAGLWLSSFWETVSDGVFRSQEFALSLSRYFTQESVEAKALLCRVAASHPGVIRTAVRHSGLVLSAESAKWVELNDAASLAQGELDEFLRLCRRFHLALAEHNALVEQCRRPFHELTPLEVLGYASLYAFEHLIPRLLPARGYSTELAAESDAVSGAINRILLWKLATSSAEDFHLTEEVIARSLQSHLIPFLFPSKDGPRPRHDMLHAFAQLVEAQRELDSFLSASVDAFCYDDSISFELRGEQIEIVERDPAARAAWNRNGEKLARLHGYWFHRAIDAFALLPVATQIIGSPENHEENRVAYIKAIRSALQLQEVYGLDESVQVETGLRVDLFQALLSLELMTAFFNKAHLLPFSQHLERTSDWRLALTYLAMGGLLESSMENRFPLTWSDRDTKLQRIRGWTVTDASPKGDPKAAAAILDFWTSDLKALAERLKRGDQAPIPELHERPLLKMGRYLFQLPWLVAIQNNSTATLNNLRRIGARRPEGRDETQRIERRLGEASERRGFKVVANFHPPRTEAEDPGDVDLIASRDDQVIVLEVKSTFLRSTKREAWLHKTSTLRKAGLQLARKMRAVAEAMKADDGLRHSLGLPGDGVPPPLHGWIADTSIEHDHERFSGFLKVSIEEILIALRDDRHLLVSVGELLASMADDALAARQGGERPLYGDGFSAARFVEVIEREEVWA